MSKIKRRDLHLKEDIFSTYINKAYHFFLEYKKWFIIGLAGILVVVLIVIGLNNYQRYRDKKARQMEDKAMTLVYEKAFALENDIRQKQQAADKEEGDSEEATAEIDKLKQEKTEHITQALAVYQELYKKYPGTPSGERALFMIADLHFRLEKTDDAYKHFQTYYERYGEDGLLYVAVIKNMASLMVMQGKGQEAVDFLRRFTEDSAFLRRQPADAVLFQLGVLLMDQEKHAQAVPVLEKLVADYPESLYKTDSEKYIQYAKLQLPAQEKATGKKAEQDGGEEALQQEETPPAADETAQPPEATTEDAETTAPAEDAAEQATAESAEQPQEGESEPSAQGAADN